MRIIGPILLALLVIGVFVTLGVTGVIDMVFTGWSTITAPGGAQ